MFNPGYLNTYVLFVLISFKDHSIGIENERSNNGSTEIPNLHLIYYVQG